MLSLVRFRRSTTSLCVLVLAPLVLAGPVTTRAQAAEPVLVVPASGVALQVAVDLPKNAALGAPGPWQLIELDHPEVVVPAQLTPALAADGAPAKLQGRLVASIPPRTGAEAPRRFALRSTGGPAGDGAFRFALRDINDKSLGLWDGDQAVFVYNHGFITKESVPETDHRRRRACYIHPVYGLGGEVLTEDFPRDHYHHHGIFWTWPHVGVEGVEYDLWAGVMGKLIWQKFDRWLAKETGPAAGLIGVQNGWYIGDDPHKADRKVMTERVWLRAYQAAGESRVLDIELTLIAGDKPVTLWGAAGKSYGGLTARFAPPTRKDPATTITVREGVTEVDLSESPQPWADYTSLMNGHKTRSGASVFIAPDHPDYPPTWLLRHYGPLCVGWPGIKPQVLQPGEPVRMNYRIWIHKSAVTAEEIQEAYEGYTTALGVTWE